MARNEVFKYSDWVSLPVADGTVSGDPVVVGELVGVAQTDQADEATANPGGGNAEGFASVALTGAWRVTVTGAAASYGLPVYITSAGALTMTATGNRLFGHTLGTKGTGAGEITVRLAHNAAGASA